MKIKGTVTYSSIIKSKVVKDKDGRKFELIDKNYSFGDVVLFHINENDEAVEVEYLFNNNDK